MATKTYTRHGKKQAPRRPSAKAPVRTAPTSARPPRSSAKAAGTLRQHTKPAQPARRQSSRRRTDGSQEWVKAGLLLAGFVVAIMLAVHFLGGSSTPPASSNNGNQASGTPGGSGPTINHSGANSIPPVVDTAQALGISPDTLLADIKSGETVPQIAQAQQVPIATVNAAYLQGVKELGNQIVQQGSASQATADQLYQREQQQVQQGQYDMLGGKVTISSGG